MIEHPSDEELSEELREHQVDHVDLNAELDEQASLAQSSVSQEGKRRRGRPPVKDAWTRVISLNDHQAQEVRQFDLATDLLMVSALPTMPSQRLDGPWAPIFSPKDHVKSLPKEELEDCRLNAKTLLKFGKEVTKFRAQFEKLAGRLIKERQDGEDGNSLSRKR